MHEQDKSVHMLSAQETLSLCLCCLVVLVMGMLLVLVLGTYIVPVGSQKADCLPAPLVVFLELLTALVHIETAALC